MDAHLIKPKYRIHHARVQNWEDINISESHKHYLKLRYCIVSNHFLVIVLKLLPSGKIKKKVTYFYFLQIFIIPKLQKEQPHEKVRRTDLDMANDQLWLSVW